MDEYLDCLFQYVSDHLEADACVNLVDYRRCSAARDIAWEALEKSLTPEQLKLVENFQSTWCGLRFLEDRLLFQKAVSLGKWMVR